MSRNADQCHDTQELRQLDVSSVHSGKPLDLALQLVLRYYW
jgi:hypothetical protein